MSIRVHKVLGYGLDDLQENDPRLLSNLYNVIENIDSKRMIKEFYMWYDMKEYEVPHGQKYNDSICLQFPTHRPDSFRPIYYEPEFGLENVLLFVPWGYENYYRYDNIIDWVEETYTQSEPQNPNIKILNNGIYPHTGRIKLNGEKITGDYNERMMSIYDQEEFRLKYPEKLTAWLDTLGFSTYNEYQEKTRPDVPFDIYLLAKFLNVFVDPNIVWTFKPMIYTYWS